MLTFRRNIKILEGTKINIFLRCCSNEVDVESRENFSHFLAKQLKIPNTKVQAFLSKNSQVYTYERSHIADVIKILDKFSLKTSFIMKYPKLFSLSPWTVESRIKILTECGICSEKIPDSLSSYLTLVSRRTVASLEKGGVLAGAEPELQERLIGCLSGWPTRPAMPPARPHPRGTLHQARMRVLQRYLELSIDLPAESFPRKLATYPRLKHRALRDIDTLLRTLQDLLKMPNSKIQTHFGVLQAHPANVAAMLSEVGSLAGVDIREVILLKPNILLVNYQSLLKIRDILNEFNIPFSSQRRCFEVFTLSPHTVRSRLLALQSHPDYSVHLQHPRVLRLVLYKTKADARLALLGEKNKKCFSLNVLSGCREHYESCAQSQGVKTKGRDGVHALCSLLDNQYSYKQVYSSLNKHQFFTKVSIKNISEVIIHIRKQFNSSEIFENCQIALYPLELVKRYLEFLLQQKYHLGPRSNAVSLVTLPIHILEGVNYPLLSNTSVLSLTIYLLEKDFYFSGNGIWPHMAGVQKQ